MFFSTLIGTLNLINPSKSIIFSGINNSIKQLEESASRLLDQGDAIGARQQGLLAEMLRSTTEQLEKSLANSVNLTFDRVDLSTQGAIRGLVLAVDEAKRSTSPTIEGVRKIVRETTSDLNEILDRIPSIAKKPVVLGITAENLLSAQIF